MDEPADRANQCTKDFVSRTVDDMNELPSCHMSATGDGCSSPDVSLYFPVK